MKKVLLLSLLFICINAISQINCVVIQWSNPSKTEFTVVNFDYEVSSLPVQGLDPSLEVLVKRTPYTIPDYDPRLKYLVTNYSVSITYDSIYPTNRKWLTTYYLANLTSSEKKISVDESENDANYKVFPNNQQLKLLTLGIAILERKASGLTITPKQQSILNRITKKGNKIWNNHINAGNKKEAIDDNMEVDLDSGWENTSDDED